MFENKSCDELLSKKKSRKKNIFSNTDVQIGLKKTLKKRYGGKGP